MAANGLDSHGKQPISLQHQGPVVGGDAGKLPEQPGAPAGEERGAGELVDNASHPRRQVGNRAIDKHAGERGAKSFGVGQIPPPRTPADPSLRDEPAFPILAFGVRQLDGLPAMAISGYSRFVTVVGPNFARMPV